MIPFDKLSALREAAEKGRPASAADVLLLLDEIRDLSNLLVEQMTKEAPQNWERVAGGSTDGSIYGAGGCGAGGITGGYGAGVSNRKGAGSTSRVVPGAGGMSSKKNPSR